MVIVLLQLIDEARACYHGANRGEVRELFKTMKVSKDIQLMWLQRWQVMDNDGSNLLDYKEFVGGCGLEDNLWSWRVFNLLDKNCTGTCVGCVQLQCNFYF